MGSFRTSVVGTVCGIASLGLAAAADPPKEGTYEYTACISGVATPIVFSKTHSATTYEQSGAILSTTPGGMFDKGTFHCVGMRTSLGDRKSQTTVCEAAFPDGGKILSVFTLGSDGKTTRESVAGTGRYEGIVSRGMVESLGPFPEVKAGTFQFCNHQTGTYRLK